MTEYLPFELALKIAALEGFLVRDPGLLDSAVLRPRSSVFGQDAYPTLAQKAAAMLFSIAQNQPLVDGSKRLALICTHVFVGLNGCQIGATGDDVFELLEHDIPAGLDDVALIADRLMVRPR